MLTSCYFKNADVSFCHETFSIENAMTTLLLLLLLLLLSYFVSLLNHIANNLNESTMLNDFLNFKTIESPFIQVLTILFS